MVILSQYKSWKITSPLPWGGLLFVAGFAMRGVSIKHTHDLNIFIATNVLLLCAPYVSSVSSDTAAAEVNKSLDRFIHLQTTLCSVEHYTMSHIYLPSTPAVLSQLSLVLILSLASSPATAPPKSATSTAARQS